MTAIAECTHGMPSPRACIECMEEGPVTEMTSWQRVGSPFRAAYPADCSGCVHLVAVGALIQRWDWVDEHTAYTHQACTPTTSPKEQP